MADKSTKTPAQPARAAARPPELGPLLRRTSVESAPPPSSAAVAPVLARAGAPLDDDTRQSMERRFGRDLSGVRVHNDSAAAESASTIGARAYTFGRDVVFGPGAYQPRSDRGQQLIAHELAHVVQQAGRTDGRQAVGASGSSAERQARHAVNGGGASALTSFAPHIAREDPPVSGTVDVIQVLPALGIVRMYTSQGVLSYSLAYNRQVEGEYTASVSYTQKETVDKKTGNKTTTDHVDFNLEKVLFGNESELQRFYFSWSWKPGQINPADLLKQTPRVRIVIGAPAAGGKAKPIDVGAGTEPGPGGRAPGGGEGGGGEQGGGGGQGVKKGGGGEGEPRLGGKEGGSGKGDKPLDDKLKDAREGFGSGMEGEGGGEPANFPAFPATMRGDGVAPVGGINTYTMSLDWAIAGSSLLAQTTTAMAPVTYFWEVYDITGAVEQSVATPAGKEKSSEEKLKDATKDVAKKGLLKDESPDATKVGKTDAAIRQFGLTSEHMKEEDKKAAEELDIAVKQRNYGDIALGLLNADPGLSSISGMIRLGGDAVGLLADATGNYEQERGIPWRRTGVFAVRCVAQPRKLTFDDGSVVRRPPSIAVKVVEVKTLEAISKDTAKQVETEDELARLLRALWEKETDPEAKAALLKSLEEQELKTSAPAAKVIESALAKKRIELAEAEASGNPYRVRDIKAQIDGLEKQLNLTKRLKGTGAVVRPRATLVSDVTGQSYPLLLQMQISGSDKDFTATISDVTTKDGGVYSGKGTSESAAAWEAARMMAGRNDYGTGQLVFVMPAGGDIKFDPTSKAMSNAPGTGQQVKRKLEDMGKVLAVLALAVPGAGEVAMVIGAGIAAERLATRFSEDRLYLDSSTVMDVISIVSAAAIGVGTLARFKPVALPGGRVGIALGEGGTVSRLAFGAAEKLNEAGMVITTADMIKSFQEINEKELKGDITHSDARKQRLSMMADAAQQGLLTIGSAIKAHKAGEAEESHTTPSKKPPLEHGEESATPQKKSRPPSETPEQTAPKKGIGSGEKPTPTERRIDGAVPKPEEHAGNVEGGPFKKPAPGENVFEGISDGTKDMLKKNPALAKALEENPRAAKAMKLCGSDCFPKHATPEQIQHMERILADAEAHGIEIANGRALRELMHGTKNAQELAVAISFVEAQVHAKIAEVGSPKAGQVRAEFEAAQKLGVHGEHPLGGESAPQGSIVIPKKFSTIKLSHDAGVDGGKTQAAKHKIKVNEDWNNPEQHIGLYGKGIDAVGDPPGGGKVILEWKGEGSPLAPGQMSDEWVGQRIAILKNLGDHMADTLLDAARKGQLTGRVYRTRIGPGGELVPRMEGRVRRYDPKRVEKAFNERLAKVQAETAAKAAKAAGK